MKKISVITEKNKFSILNEFIVALHRDIHPESIFRLYNGKQKFSIYITFKDDGYWYNFLSFDFKHLNEKIHKLKKICLIFGFPKHTFRVYISLLRFYIIFDFEIYDLTAFISNDFIFLRDKKIYLTEDLSFNIFLIDEIEER